MKNVTKYQVVASQEHGKAPRARLAFAVPPPSDCHYHCEGGLLFCVCYPGQPVGSCDHTSRFGKVCIVSAFAAVSAKNLSKCGHSVGLGTFS